MTLAATDAVPSPVLFNPWKHHAGWLRERVADAVRGGSAALERLAAESVVIGTRLMDLYHGPLAPADVAVRILTQLREQGRLDRDSFRTWLAGQGDYAVLTVPDDGSRWTLRLGPTDGRYVHLHPGRRSPHTVRVQANALRTAVLARALAGVTGRSPWDAAVVNEARQRFLGLPPVPAVTADGGLGVVIDLLAVPGRS